MGGNPDTTGRGAERMKTGTNWRGRGRDKVTEGLRHRGPKENEEGEKEMET